MERIGNSNCNLCLQISPTLSLPHTFSLDLCLPWTQVPTLSSWASYWLWSLLSALQLSLPYLLCLLLLSDLSHTPIHSCSVSPSLFSELDLTPQKSAFFTWPLRITCQPVPGQLMLDAQDPASVWFQLRRGSHRASLALVAQDLSKSFTEAWHENPVIAF